MIRRVTDGFRKFYFTKSEMILRTMPRFAEAEAFENTYNQYLESAKSKGNFDSTITKFPIKSFNKFPKSTMERLIKSSYEVIKSNDRTNTIYSYNSVLISYSTHKIDFDISAVMNDMVKNNIQFNDLTYSLFIDLYSERGDMTAVENLIQAMKSNGVKVNDKTKYAIYSGYLRAKKFDMAEGFLKAENIEENVKLLVQRCKAYADIDCFKEILETLEKIRAIEPNLPGKLSWNIYRRLAKVMAPDSELEQIFAMGNVNDHVNMINLILYLNSDGFYNHSLKIMINYPDTFVDETSTYNIIKSFRSRDCPNNIYMSVLERFTANIFPNAYLNLFKYIDFDAALKMCERLITTDNAQCLLCSLLLKSVQDGSIEHISMVIQLMEEKLELRTFNTVLQYVLIPNLLECKLISKPEECLKILPHKKKLLLPSLFMYCLCKGDFVSFESLLSQNIINYPLRYLNFSRTTAKVLLDNVPFKEIEKVATTVSKVFSPQFVNWLIGSIVTERIVQLSADDDIESINEAIKVAKNLGVTFEPRDMFYVEKRIPKYRSLFTEMEIREEASSVELMGNEDQNTSR